MIRLLGHWQPVSESWELLVRLRGSLGRGRWKRYILRVHRRNCRRYSGKDMTSGNLYFIESLTELQTSQEVVLCHDLYVLSLVLQGEYFSGFACGDHSRSEDSGVDIAGD
jgi:hypothetical protein